VPHVFIFEAREKAGGAITATEQSVEGNCNCSGRELLRGGAPLFRQAFPDSASSPLTVDGLWRATLRLQISSLRRSACEAKAFK
jgi:hypothetical protein